MTTNPAEDEGLKAPIAKELEDAEALAKSFDFEELKSGDWFIRLLRQVVRAYDRNARASYFQQKYPGVSPDEIADTLTSITVRYATIAGAIAGVAASAGEIAAIGSAGITAALFVASIGGEMIYLANIQMRLVLDMSVIYDLQLDPEDPEDILMIFGYALGVAPTELIGKGAQVAAARGGTKTVIQKVVSKGTLAAVQKFAQRLGFKILQRTIIKFAVPVAAAAVGSGYNYITTKSVGQIAKVHFRHRGKVSDELRILVSKQNTYDLAMPAAVMFMAQVDGTVSVKEKELYKAMLSRMSLDDHTPQAFSKLIKNDASILDAIGQIEDMELRKCLVELLTLMAMYDGVLADEELSFLTQAASRLNVEINISEVAQRTKEYQTIVEKNRLQKAAGAVGSAAVSAIGSAGQTAGRLKDLLLRHALKRPVDEPVTASSTPVQSDPLEGLEKLKQMFEAGLITQNDFDAKKAEILSRL